MEKNMSLGLLGRKIGMTEIFDEEGNSIPVTVIESSELHVTQVKVAQTDGYNAVQIAFGKRKAKHTNKAQIGQVTKAGVKAGLFTKEFRLEAEEIENFQAGQSISID